MIKDFQEKQTQEAKEKQGLIIRNKIRAMGRLGKIYTTLKDEYELLLKIKQMAPDGRLPHGLLLAGKPAIKNALKQFELAKKLDSKNEKRPPPSKRTVSKKK